MSMHALRIMLLCTLACTAATAFAGLSGQWHDSWTSDFPTISGEAGDEVLCAQIHDGLMYIGGTFEYAGPRNARRVGAFDPATGDPSTDMPRVSGAVTAMADDGNGGMYIVGWFNSVNGVPRRNAAHVDANGQVTGFNPDLDNCALSVAVSADRVYISGYFEFAGAERRTKIAAFDRLGNLLPWNPVVRQTVTSLQMPQGLGTLTITATVYAVALDGDNVVMCGSFDKVADATGVESTRKGVAALDPNGNLLAWDANMGTAAAFVSVSEISVGSDGIFALGTFTTVSGRSQSKVAKLTRVSGNGELASGWSASLGGSVWAITAYGTECFVAGNFSGHVAKLGAGGGQVPGWTLQAPPVFPGGMSGLFYTLHVHDDVLYAGGVLSTSSYSGLIAAKANGLPTDADFFRPAPRCGGEVRCVTSIDGKVVAGGDFVSFGGVTRGSMAAVDMSTGQVADWAPQCEINSVTKGKVRALTVDPDNGHIFIGGNFNTVNGETRVNLACLDENGALVSSWNTPVIVGGLTSTTNSVYCLLVDNGVLYIGGVFTSINGVSRKGLVAVSATTGAVMADWNVELGAGVFVRSLQLHDDDIIVGISYYATTTIGWAGSYVSRTGVAIVRKSGLLDAGAVQPFAPLFTITAAPQYGAYHVDTLVLDGDILYAGGYFDAVNGQPRGNLCAFDLTSGTLLPWDPNVTGNTVDGSVYTLAIRPEAVYVASQATSVGGASGNPAAARKFFCAFERADSGATGATVEWDVDARDINEPEGLRRGRASTLLRTKPIFFNTPGALYYFGILADNDYTGTNWGFNAGGMARFLNAPSITTARTLPAGNAGHLYSATIDAEGYGPFDWSHTSLPSGLTLAQSAFNDHQAVLSGTLAAASAGHVFSFDITARDVGNPNPAPHNSATASFELWVEAETFALPFNTGWESGDAVPTNLTAGTNSRVRIDGSGAHTGDAGLVIDAMPGDQPWSVTQTVADDPTRWAADAATHTGSLNWSVDIGTATGMTVGTDLKIFSFATNAWYTNLVFEWSDDNGANWNNAYEAGHGSVVVVTGGAGIYRLQTLDTAGTPVFQPTSIAVSGIASASGEVHCRLRWLVRWALDDTLGMGIMLDNLSIQPGSVTPTPGLDVREALSGLWIPPGSMPAAGRDFGPCLIGGVPATALAIAVTNSGPADLILTVPQLSGAGAANFALDIAGFLTALAPGATASFTVAFNPAVEGQQTATISFNAPGVISPYTMDVTGLAVGALSITSPGALPTGLAGQGYQQQLLAHGGVGPFAWSSTDIPAGWSLSPAGLLSAPAASASEGVYTFTAALNDSSALPQQASQTFTVEIRAALPPSIGPIAQSSAGCAIATGATMAGNAGLALALIAGLLALAVPLRRTRGERHRSTQ